MERIKRFFETTAGKIVAGVVAGLLVLILVSSCISRPTQYAGVVPAQTYAQPAQVAPAAGGQPVIVNNTGGGGGHSGIGDAIVGSAIGSYIGNRLAQPSQVAPVHSQPTYTTTAPAQRYVAPVQTTRSAPVYQKPTVTTSSTRPGYSTTTRTTSSGRTSISAGSSSRRR